ncbi:hypothetical protein [Streptomyces erythrochromogenes]|uniref:hypothetical protein n=1 Tax=Streptomyces erythrochromogenes TaxID=285574 RepID=UPI0033C4BDB4
MRDAELRAPNPVVAVGVEVDGVGNEDDVVLYRQAPPHTYMQAKYAADSSTPVNEDYLLKLSNQGGQSILRPQRPRHHHRPRQARQHRLHHDDLL